MATGKHGDPTVNNLVIQLHTVNPKVESANPNDLELPSRDCAQTVSFCTSFDSLTRRIQTMQNKGFGLTAIAGQDGKFVSAFTRVSVMNRMNIIETLGADPGVSHNYRLSTNTLHSVAHNGRSWMFAYLSEKVTGSQTILKCQTLENLLAQVKVSWKRNFRITALAFGDGFWVAVGTQIFEPDEQSFFTATDPEALQEKTKKAWDEGRRISAIAYGCGKWLVILNRAESDSVQKWLTRKSFVDLRNRIREEWARGFQVTALARGSDVWLAVLSRPAEND